MLTLFLVSAPVAFLISFDQLRVQILSADFLPQNGEHDLLQIAVTEDSDNFSAIEHYIADAIAVNFNYKILYERIGSVSVIAKNKAQKVRVSFISETFEAMGWEAEFGDFGQFFEALKQQKSVAAVSYRYWTEELNRDPNVIGQTLNINEHIVEVLAVMPANFDRLRKYISVDVVLPYYSSKNIIDREPEQIGSDVYSYLMADGGIKTSVGQELTEFLLSEAYIFAGTEVKLSNAIGQDINEFDRVSNRISVLHLLFISLLVFCILSFIATYIASLNDRLQERTVRTLCGASAADLFKQQVVELLLFGLFSTILVGLLSLGLFSYSNQIVGVPEQHVQPLIVSKFFTLLMAYFIIFSSIIWAINIVQYKSFASHIGRGSNLSSGWKLQNYFIMSLMCTISALVVFITTLIYFSLKEQQNIQLGFSANDIKLVSFEYPDTRRKKYYKDDKNKLLYHSAVDKFGEENFSVAVSPPLSVVTSYAIWLDSSQNYLGGSANSQIEVDTIWPNFFKVMGTKIIYGRSLDWQSDFEVVVSQSLWDKHFTGQDISTATLMRPASDGEYLTYKVVGVVENVYRNGSDSEPPHRLYTLLNTNTGFESFVVKTQLSDERLRSELGQLLNNLEQQEKKIIVQSMEQLLNAREKPMKLQFLIGNVISGLTLLASIAFSFSVISQIFTATAREVSLKFSVGASVLNIALQESKLFSTLALIMVFITSFFLTQYKIELSLLFDGISILQLSYLFYYFLALVLLLNIFIYYRTFIVSKNSWRHLT